jgi:hypothetical protein
VFAQLGQISTPSEKLETGIYSRQDAKTAKLGIVFSLAAFAPLRESF